MDINYLKYLSGKHRFNLGMIEKDYVLTNVLYKISEDELKNYLIFKGGTALNKVYLSHYRLSEDLDFTLVDCKLRNAKNIILDIIKKMGYELKQDSLSEISYSSDIKFTDLLNHPNSIKIDISKREKPLLKTVFMKVKHFYPDMPKFEIQTLQLKELAAEKLRAIIQRKKPRDYFDLFVLLRRYDVADLQDLAKRKMESVNDKFNLDNIFNDLERIKILWKKHLFELVTDLPKFETVIKGLKSKLLKE